jgi:hypothetical protein
MTDPRPWRDAPADVSPDVARVVTLAASVPPRPLDLTGWDEVVVRAAAPRRDWRLVPAFMLSALAGVALVLVARPASPRALAEQAGIVAEAGATWSREQDERVALRSGRLTISVTTGQRVHVVTPHAEVEAQQARFLAEVTESGTLVVVEEGEVVLRTPEGRRVVRAGESLLWPPAPDIPQALLAEPIDTAPTCAETAGAQRADCLAGEASGDGLDAQAALYELGTLQLATGERQAALDTFRGSLTRFPDGVLHPEVRLALLVELVRARRFSEAAAAARDFEAACVEDPRVGDVAALRRALERR